MKSMILGYLRRYPADLVDAWSSGTGMAGVTGSTLYLLAVVLGLTDQQTFFILCPTVGLYVIYYFMMLVEPKTLEQDDLLIVSEESYQIDEILLRPEYDDVLSQEFTIQDELTSETKLQRYWRCTRLVSFLMTQLCLVYFFEYVSIIGAADKSNPTNSPVWFVRHAYEILSFCYQIGVLISRSSLKFVQIQRIEVITILQCINFILWLLQAKFKFINIWVQFGLMMYVGLLGGASYVNIFYRLLHDNIPERDRELCINLVAMATTAGITLASLFTLVVDATFLKHS